MRFATPARRGNKDMKYVGKLESMLFIRVTLISLDKHIIFQSTVYLFSNIVANRLGLIGAPNERPKYFKMAKKKPHNTKSQLTDPHYQH